MKASEDLILREIAGEYVLIPVGEAALHLHGMISLTESGQYLWKKLQNDISEEELVQSLLSEYDIDEQTACQDVREFLEKLGKLGIVR